MIMINLHVLKYLFETTYENGYISHFNNLFENVYFFVSNNLYIFYLIINKYKIDKQFWKNDKKYIVLYNYIKTKKYIYS